MIDIHSHILPALDDGAGTLETSVAMVKMAAEHGTTDIVATPHADLKYSFDPALVRQKAEELRLAVGPVPRIHTGCDFHLYYDNIQDAVKTPEKYTINQRCYLLVEFSDLLILKTTSEILGTLREAGIIPVITHPERNLLLQYRLDDLARWVEEGSTIQVTAQSFLGRFGQSARRVSEELLRRGLVHFVASDAHDTKHRPPVLDQAFQWVARRYGLECAERLFIFNPGAALAGKPLQMQGFSPPPMVRKWYQFWR